MKRKIFCYGDSLTYGYDPRDIFGRPYDVIWTDLLGKHLPAEIVNAGQPGRELPYLDKQLEWLKRDLDVHAPITDLVLMLGTNDVLNMFHNDMERIGNRMERLVCFLQNYDSSMRIHLIAPPRIRLEETWRSDALTELARVYQQLAQTYSLHFLDATVIPFQLAFDGIHMTQEDQYLFADFLYCNL